MKRNMWPFGTNQPLGPVVSYGKRRPVAGGRRAAAPMTERQEKAAAAAKRARKLDDPDLERKLRTHYARGGNLNEFLQANPGFKAYFDKDSEAKSKAYQGYRIWPVRKGWKTSLSVLPTFETERDAKKFIDAYLAVNAGKRAAGRNPSAAGAVPKIEVIPSRRKGQYDVFVGGIHRVTKPTLKGAEGYADRLRRNPSAAAADVYEEFHGTPSTEIVEVTKRVHFHKHLAALGKLEALVVARSDGEHRLVGFKAAKLCANERKNQLFVEGGDQSLESKDFGFREWPHEKNTLGVVTRLEYFTTKTHLGKEGGTAIYFHEPGKAERGQSAGVGPDLIYDAVNECLEFSGGTYEIRAEGIDK